MSQPADDYPHAAPPTDRPLHPVYGTPEQRRALPPPPAWFRFEARLGRYDIEWPEGLPGTPEYAALHPDAPYGLAPGEGPVVLPPGRQRRQLLRAGWPWPWRRSPRGASRPRR